MRAPQIIVIVLYSIRLFEALGQHGHTVERTHNFWKTLLGTAIAAAILWWGGFWG